MEKVKVFIRGWLGYFHIADMKQNCGRMGQMAKEKIPDVYLEAVEETQNKDSEPAETWNPGVAGLPMGEHQTWLLAYRW